MLSESMLKALNSQITKEYYSSYLYLQMAAWCDHNSLPGFAHWMKVQAKEEDAHATILFNYVTERGGMIDLGPFEKPPAEYSSNLDVFEKVLVHEEYVTSSINKLMTMAIQEEDYATKARLDWFISEQVEEEANAGDMVGKLKLVGSDSNGLFFLDKELAARTFNVPSPLAGKAI